MPARLRPSLRQLELFAAVAQTGSFSRAAEQMHLTQPAVSIQVKNLEEAIGLPLFEQIGRRIYLTDAGRELLAFCDEVFRGLARFEMSLADMKGLKKGALRLAVTTTAKYFIPRLLGRFASAIRASRSPSRSPTGSGCWSVWPRTRTTSTSWGSPGGHGRRSDPVPRKPNRGDGARDHPLAARKAVPLERLAEEPFLVREAGSGTRQAAERFFAERGLTPKVRMELGSNEAIKQGIIGGLGVAVLSRHTLSAEGEASQIAVIDVAGFPIRREWYVVYPAGKRLSVVSRAFLDYLLDTGKLLLDTEAKQGTAA